MKKLYTLLLVIAAAMISASCGRAAANPDDSTPNTSDMTDLSKAAETDGVKVKFETTDGDFTVLLYNDTPKHRDNFVKLVEEGFYNGVLFHRVIPQFMIQTGDPDSREARAGQRLGAGGPGYTIEAEIDFPRHFHKRGALAAARQADQVNPERRSSGSQFYVVTGRKYIPAQLEGMRQQMRNQQMQATFNGLASARMEQIRTLQAQGDTTALENLRRELIAETERIVAESPMTFTPEMEEAYTKVGGAPHLDGQYTVFGEVIEGLDVIEKIEKAPTDAADRPNEDVRIVKATILK